MDLRSQRIKNALYYFFSSFLLNVAPIILSLWLLPKLIGLLSEERFGVFKTLAELVGFLGVFTVSYAASLNQKFARASQTAGLLPELSRETSFSIQLAFVFILIGGPILILSAPSSIGSTHISNREIYWGAFFGILNLIWLPSLVLQSYFEAQQLGYKTNLIFLFQRIFIVVASYLAALYWPTLSSQFLTIFIAGGLVFLVQILLVAKAKVSINPFIESFKNFKTNLSNKLHGMIPYFKIDFAGRISMSGDILLISWLINNTAVSHFYLAMRLPAMLTTQLMSVGNSVWSGFADLYHRGETEKYLKVFNVSSKLVIWLSSFCAGLIFIFNKPFLLIWLKNDLDISNYFFLISGLNLIPIALISLWGWFLTSIHQESIFGKISSQSALINLLLGIILTKLFGLTGPIAASLVAYGIFKIILLSNIICKTLTVSRKNLFIMAIKPILFSTLFFASTAYLTYNKPVFTSWTVLLISCLAIALIYWVVAWILILDSTEKSFIRNFIKKD